jgi:hypothetical protein
MATGTAKSYRPIDNTTTTWTNGFTQPGHHGYTIGAQQSARLFAIGTSRGKEKAYKGIRQMLGIETPSRRRNLAVSRQ